MESFMTFKRIGVIVLLVILSGCASPVKQINDINIPFQRPYYSVLSPQEKDWVYLDQNQAGTYNLYFGKDTNSPTHTLVAIVTELHSSIRFDTREEFLKYVEKSKELDTDPRRFKIIKYDINLNDKFGEYCIKYYAETEDHQPANLDGNDFLVLKLYGYTFLHPYFKNVAVDISYSERGIPQEISSDFDVMAEKFLNGLVLKN